MKFIETKYFFQYFTCPYGAIAAYLAEHATQHIALQGRGKRCQTKFLNILREKSFANFREIR